jgi:hypothetical protein
MMTMKKTIPKKMMTMLTVFLKKKDIPQKIMTVYVTVNVTVYVIPKKNRVELRTNGRHTRHMEQ